MFFISPTGYVILGSLLFLSLVCSLDESGSFGDSKNKDIIPKDRDKMPWRKQ